MPDMILLFPGFALCDRPIGCNRVSGTSLTVAFSNFGLMCLALPSPGLSESVAVIYDPIFKFAEKPLL